MGRPVPGAYEPAVQVEPVFIVPCTVLTIHSFWPSADLLLLSPQPGPSACSGLVEEEGSGPEPCGRGSSSRDQTQAQPIAVSICSRGRRNDS